MKFLITTEAVETITNSCIGCSLHTKKGACDGRHNGWCASKQILKVKYVEPATYNEYLQAQATALWEQFYKQEWPDWEPSDDTEELITQIGNMVAGLHRTPDDGVIDGTYKVTHKGNGAILLRKLP